MIIMGGDKKKLAGIVVSKALGPLESESSESESKPEEDLEESLTYAANDIMKAVEANDLLALKSSLKSFWEICDNCPKEDNY
jgi:homoserine acetyltransferase